MPSSRAWYPICIDNLPAFIWWNMNTYHQHSVDQLHDCCGTWEGRGLDAFQDAGQWRQYLIEVLVGRWQGMAWYALVLHLRFQYTAPERKFSTIKIIHSKLRNCLKVKCDEKLPFIKSRLDTFNDYVHDEFDIDDDSGNTSFQFAPAHRAELNHRVLA